MKHRHGVELRYQQIHLEVSCYEAWHRFLECYDLSNHVEVIDQIVDEHNRRHQVGQAFPKPVVFSLIFSPKNRTILERLLGSTGTNSWELSQVVGHVAIWVFTGSDPQVEPYKLARMSLSNARREMLTPNASSKYRDWEYQNMYIRLYSKCRVSNHLSVVSSSLPRARGMCNPLICRSF